MCRKDHFVHNYASILTLGKNRTHLMNNYEFENEDVISLSKNKSK